MAYSARYRGFSTQKNIDSRGLTFSTADQETVKTDLLNFIYTIPGERVMFPNFGTRIPVITFEPLDPGTVQIIKDDLTKAVQYDPRLRLIDLAVMAIPDNNTIAAFIDVLYVELGTTETLKLEFGFGS